MICAANWYAVQTRPRNEPFVSAMLCSKGYEVFLPQSRSSGVARAGSASVDQALFPGYLFCWVPQEAPGRIVTTPGVIRILGVGGRPTPLPVEEIENIRRAVDSGIQVNPWPRLEEGDEVEVLNGPLAGCSGILVRWRSINRIIISVAMLHRSIAVDVDLSWVALRARRAAQQALAAVQCRGLAG